MNQATKRTLHRRAITAGPRFGVVCCFVGLLLTSVGVTGAADDGAVRRAWLGVSTKDIGAQLQTFIRQEFDLESEAGVSVVKVLAGSPAEKAGLRENDVILRVGSTLITGGQQLARTIAPLDPRQPIQITFFRNMKIQKTRAILSTVASDEGPSETEPPAERAANPGDALFAAAARGDTGRVAALIRNGADVRASNRAGQLPLHAACAAGHAQVAKLLIDADRVRAEAELRGTLIPDFGEYMRRMNPTLSAPDFGGDHPLHLAAKNGRTAVAKLLVDSGADKEAQNLNGQTAGQIAAQRQFGDLSELLGGGGNTFEPALDSTPITVTRYAPKLRELAAQAQEIERRFAQAQSAPVPQTTVAALGTELFRLGTELESLLASSDTTMTRFGTIEEADLLEAIRAAHEQSATALRAQALVELETTANSTGPSRNQMRAALRNVGRELIEREAVQWMRKNGLEDLLVENGQSAFRGQVSQGIELNLRTFLDKKSIEVVGMPLGGFRSVQATFRLQARREVRQLVAKLVLNFSGNQLVVELLQRHIVRWIETDLWPQLREAFRPKTRLDRRVRISAATMSQAGEALNNLVKGRQPADVPLLQVRDAVDRAEGTMYAARYLERDLKRAKNQELIDQLQKAKDRLQRDIRRIRHQYLLANADRWDEMRDNLECTLGVHDDVGKILDAMREEDRRVRAAVQRVIRAMISEDTEGVMAVIHEQSPLHSREAAARLRAYFASHEMLRDNVDITKITKQSDQDVKVTMVEMVGSSRQTFGLVFRRSGATWKLYGPGDGS